MHIEHALSRRAFVAGSAACLALALSACSSSDSDSSSDATSSDVAAMRIGTLQTEDSLPFWAAEEEGFFADAGVEVDIITFQSAQELSTAFAAGEIDGAMTDVQVSAALVASGIDLTLAWVTLGTEADQGRFGIMTSPDSGITSLEELAGQSIAVGSNTVPEYVMDVLLESVGLTEDDVTIEEIKKLPVRYEAMANNQVAAAALPGSLLALGEASGLVLLADDTEGVGNISQSVFAVNTEWAEGEGAAALAAVQEAWNAAVAAINADAEAYRDLLVETASLSDVVADSYPVPTYPEATVPTSDMVEPVLEWMQEKGYLSVDLAYDEATGALSAA